MLNCENVVQKIFDAHSHCSNNKKSILDFFSSHINNNIFTGIVMINPFVEEIKCHKDKSHYLCIKSISKDNDMLYCTNCNKTYGAANTIFRDYNANLIEQVNIFNAKYNTKFYPFLNVASSQRMMIDEFNFFKDEYKKKFWGIKIYTGLSYNILDEIDSLDLTCPLIIHTAMRYGNQQPKNMLRFLLKYKGPILLAHFARFDLQTIQILKNKNNIFYDSSPATLLYETFYANEKSSFSCVEELYYKIFDLVGCNKVLWGSDFPFGNIRQELTILNQLNISNSERNLIAWENSKRFLNYL